MKMGLQLGFTQKQAIAQELEEVIFTAHAQDAVNGSELGQSWVQPTNALTDNNFYAELNSFTDTASKSLQIRNLNFTGLNDTDPLVDAEGLGFCMVLSIRRHNTDTVNKVNDSSVKLLSGGALIGANKASASNWPNTETLTFYTWTKAELNALGFFTVGDLGSDFGAGLIVAANLKNSGLPEVFVDHMVIQLAVLT